MSDLFDIATLENSFVRMALTGASGAGKTLTALKIANYLAPQGRVVVLETERDTARLYVNDPDTPKPYYIKKLTSGVPKNYIKWITNAANEGFDVCIIDSLSPSWNGKGGVLDIAGGDIRGWKAATPEYQSLVDCVTGFNTQMHVIATLRSKMEYALVTDEATGKLVVTKKGMAPIARDELVYEFDIVGDMDMAHTVHFGGVGKSRCSALDGKTFDKPGKDVANIISRWLGGNER